MAESFGTPAEVAEAPGEESSEPIFTRTLDRLETTTHSNPNGA